MIGAPVEVGVALQSPVGVPMTVASVNRTVVEPEAQPSVAVTVTTPPAAGFGVSTLPVMLPGGVSSSRCALQVSFDASTAAVPPPANVPVAVNGMGAAAPPSRATVVSAGA